MNDLTKFILKHLSNKTELKKVVNFDDFYQLMVNMGMANDVMKVYEIYLDLTEKKSYYFHSEKSSEYYKEYLMYMRLQNTDRKIFQNREHTVAIMKLEPQVKFLVPEEVKEMFKKYKKEEEND